ncbi:MAG: protein kinase [Verrucomicrobiales bacterium]|nr:protein kinase [Verrucomicrobiales bacterium]
MAERQRIGTYDILHGSGGEPLPGIAFLTKAAVQARRLPSGKLVSLEIADGEAGKRLAASAAQLCALNHPGILHIEEVGTDSESAFCAVNGLGNENLRSRIKTAGAISEAASAAICRQVAETLASLHADGILHGDIKPANLWLPEDAGSGDRIRLGGFHQLTEDVRAYSPEYASPEQVREETPDVRTDLFSLGMTWWHLLLGSTPLTGPVGSLLTERIDPSRSYARKLPASLTKPIRELLESLLEKEAHHRPESAHQVAAALADFLAKSENEAESRQSVRRPARPSPESRAAERSRTWRERFQLVDEDRSNLSAGHPVEAVESATGRRVRLELLPGLLPEGLRQKAAQHAGSSAALQNFMGFLDANEGTLAIWALEGTEDLLSVLRRCGKVSFADSVAFLAHLALAFDDAHSMGFPAVDARISEIGIHLPDGNWADATSAVRPIFLREQAGSGDSRPEAGPVTQQTMMPLGLHATGGLSSEEGFSYTASFASLIYYLTGGRPPAVAARISPAALTKISGFSEAGNNLVGRAIAGEFGQSHDCREFLRQLARTENITCRIQEIAPNPPSSTGNVISLNFPALASPTSGSNQSAPASVAVNPRVAMQLLDSHEGGPQSALTPTVASRNPDRGHRPAPTDRVTKNVLPWWLLGLLLVLGLGAAVYFIVTKAPHLL